MKRLTVTLGALLALGGAGYAYYRLGLSESDRQAIGNMVSSARDLIDEAKAMVEPLSVQTAHSSDAERAANREDTRRQWEELGY